MTNALEPLYILVIGSTLVHISQSNSHRHTTPVAEIQKQSKTQNIIIENQQSSQKKKKKKKICTHGSRSQQEYVQYHFSKALPSGARRIAWTLLPILDGIAIGATVEALEILLFQFYSRYQSKEGDSGSGEKLAFLCVGHSHHLLFSATWTWLNELHPKCSSADPTWAWLQR